MNVFSANQSSVEVWAPPSGVSVSIDGFGEVGYSWFVSNVTVNAREITDIRQCFNDVSYIYALGNDQRQCNISVSFVVMIGSYKCFGSDALENIDSGLLSYEQNRISQNPVASYITIGGLARRGWLVGIDVTNVDASKGICSATASFIMDLSY